VVGTAADKVDGCGKCLNAKKALNNHHGNEEYNKCKMHAEDL
jgi:hypothetical protein